MVTLNARAWLSLAVLAVVMGLLLFVPAGTLDYPQAWVYLALFFGLSAVITRDLMRRDPALLERRMRGGPTAESRPQQRLIMLGLSIGFIARVYRENTYTSATIEVTEGQRVISTGPYAVVRHPLYASALLYLLGTPPALGSWWGLLPLAFMVPFLVWRLLDEERVLARELSGYTDYRRRVRHRLIPYVW